MKIRTDFVTNSSSSSFTVQLSVVDIHGNREEIARFAKIDGDEWEEYFIFCGFWHPNYDEELPSNIESIEHLGLRKIVKSALESVNERWILNTLLRYINKIRMGNIDTLDTVEERILTLFIAEYLKSRDVDVKNLDTYNVTKSIGGHGECFDTVRSALPPWKKVMEGSMTDEEYAELYHTDPDSIKIYREIQNYERGMAKVTENQTAKLGTTEFHITYSLDEYF